MALYRKYNSKKTEYKGMKFDSKLEAKFYQRLELEKDSGVISEFEWQVPIQLHIPINLEFEFEINSHLEISDAVRMLNRKDMPYIESSFMILGGRQLTKTRDIKSFNLNDKTTWVVSHKRGKENWLIKVNGKKLFAYSSKRMFTYICDFVIRDSDGFGIYLDTKGYKTPMYKLKKKMVEANYGIKICEASKVTEDISDFFCD